MFAGRPAADDYHQLWIDPANSSRMVLGTDQGASVSVDGGLTWSSWFNQPIGQFYHVTTDNGFPYAVYGAQQDSGSAAVYSRTDHGVIAPMDWFLVGGGESGWIVVDPDDQNILYVTSAYGGVSRFDRRTSLSQDISPWPMPTWSTEIDGRKYRAPWAPMLVMSPADKNALLLGTQYVMKTTDGGLHWEKISPDLTGAVASSEKATTASYGTERERARIWRRVLNRAVPVEGGRDLGGKRYGTLAPHDRWREDLERCDTEGLEPWSKIAMIEASHFEAAEAYAAVDRHRLDDQAPYLYRTKDYGKTWQPIVEWNRSERVSERDSEDTKQRGLLFAGTELGVYVSFDDGDHWQAATGELAGNVGARPGDPRR